MISQRKLNSGDLVYTKNCGLIDREHANPGDSAALWRRIERNETDASKWSNDRTGFQVRYTSGFGTGAIKLKSGGNFFIRHGLTTPEKRQVCLGIFTQVRNQMEDLQGSLGLAWLPRARNSSWSIEDPVSNHVGWYEGVMNLSWESHCELFDPDISQEVYNNHRELLDSSIGTMQPLLLRNSQQPNLETGHYDLPELYRNISPIFPVVYGFYDRQVDSFAVRSWVHKDGTVVPQ